MDTIVNAIIAAAILVAVWYLWNKYRGSGTPEI